MKISPRGERKLNVEATDDKRDLAVWGARQLLQPVLVLYSWLEAVSDNFLQPHLKHAMPSRAGIATGRSADVADAEHVTQVGEVLRLRSG